MHTLLKCCLTTVLLATTCNGFRLPNALEEERLLKKREDLVHHLRFTRSAEDPLEEREVNDTSTEHIQGKEGFNETINLEDDPDGISSGKATEFQQDSKEIESRADTGDIELIESREAKIESRAAKINIPKGIAASAQFEPDRTGFLFGLFPFLTGRYANRVHYRGSPPPHRPKYHPTTPYKSPIHPSEEHPHEHSHDSHGPEFEIYEPDPLPPFPLDGPHFNDYLADFPEPLHEFPVHEDEGFHIPKKPDHSSDHEGFDDHNFEFDFKPPDFFEHSGFPHPPEEEDDYLLQNDQPYHEVGEGGGGHHDLDYPMKPYSDDDKVEFYPPDDLITFKPIIYKGPPKPPKFIPPGPKPEPFFHEPHHPMFPPDVNMIVEKGIYRGDIPFKEVHNDRDQIRDDLEHGGVKGLDPDTIHFIVEHTKDYRDPGEDIGDGWRRKDTVV